jgi:diaminobutyrate-2-oxoglutarate transaminase
MPSAGTAARVVKSAFSNGLIIETSGPDDEIVKCLAALTIADDELKKGLDILAGAVHSVLEKAGKAAA